MKSKVMYQLESGIRSQEAAVLPEPTGVGFKVSPGGTETHVCLHCHRRWRILSVLAFYWIQIEGQLSWNVPTLCSEVNR